MEFTFPFCFYERRFDLQSKVFLEGVRFRYQFHKSLDTNRSYGLVVYYPTGNYLEVYETNKGDSEAICTVDMEIQVRVK